jgi:hypothetical protein
MCLVHTRIAHRQAVAGALLGTALGYSWFQAYFAADVQKSLRFVCKTRLFQWLRINFVEGNAIYSFIIGL